MCIRDSLRILPKVGEGSRSPAGSRFGQSLVTAPIELPRNLADTRRIAGRAGAGSEPHPDLSDVTMLKAFVDDSGSGGDSKWFVLAGYAGTVEQWDLFDSLWLEALNRHPRIEYFHAAEAESCRGPFQGWDEKQRNAKIDSLIDVIEQCACWSICARVRQSDYDEIIKGRVPRKWDSPYYFLFQILIGSAVTIERLHGDSDPIEFVFDGNERFDKLSDSLVKTFYNREFFKGVVNVSYRDDKKFLPLQAADLFAWQTRRAYSVKEPRRAHYTRSRIVGEKPPHSHIMTRAEISRFMAEMKAEGERLGKPKDMRTW